MSQIFTEEGFTVRPYSFDDRALTGDRLAAHWGKMLYLSPEWVRQPGYRVSGWKIRDEIDENYLTYSEYKEFGEVLGVGKATKNGIELSNYYADSDGSIIFEPGDAFWVSEKAAKIPHPDSLVDDYPEGEDHFWPRFRKFDLVPVWEADPDYKLPSFSTNQEDSSTDSYANPFDDVKKGDWYYDWVVKSNAAGLMTGLNSTHFGPNDKMSRAMVVTVLYRMAGSPELWDDEEDSNKPVFPDVPNGQWYTDAVKWANENKVVTGYDNGKFGPDDNVTREQLATMICRYQSKVAGKNISYRASLDKFPDKKNVNNFAKSSLEYCVAKGIISGSNGNLLPVDNATRAECAKMLLVAKNTN